MTRSYKRGDRVLYSDEYAEGWQPGRVISVDAETSDIKIATSLTYVCEEGVRYLPVGTPVYRHVRPRITRLVAADPDWNPYTVKPFMTPSQYALLGGTPGFSTPGIPGMSHVGAYMPGIDYDEGDPAWVWENEFGWRRAIVISGQRSWVAARYVDGFRLPNGRTSKSYRPAKVWPVICDYPKAVTSIEVEEKWSRIADYDHALAVMKFLRNRSRLGRHPGL